MPAFPSSGLAERIVQVLQTGPLETTSLIKRLQKDQPQLTPQGIYKALRGLRQQEIAFLQHQEVTLNLRWLHELERFLTLTQHAYRDPIGYSGNFLQLQDGDKITYAFKNPLQVDAFWNHILYSLFAAFPKIDRWFAYASHCWFLLGRREEELALQRFMKKQGIKYLFTVGHQLALDKAIKSDFDGLNAQYAMLDRPLFTERSNHLGIVINVVGPYIIEAHYDKQTVEHIEAFYQTHNKLTQETQRELESVVALPARIKLTVSHQSSKAQKLAHLFEKRFYIPKTRS